jgi:hypothetical protein
VAVLSCDQIVYRLGDKLYFKSLYAKACKQIEVKSGKNLQTSKFVHQLSTLGYIN